MLTVALFRSLFSREWRTWVSAASLIGYSSAIFFHCSDSISKHIRWNYCLLHKVLVADSRILQVPHLQVVQLPYNEEPHAQKCSLLEVSFEWLDSLRYSEVDVLARPTQIRGAAMIWIQDWEPSAASKCTKNDSKTVHYVKKGKFGSNFSCNWFPSVIFAVEGARHVEVTSDQLSSGADKCLFESVFTRETVTIFDLCRLCSIIAIVAQVQTLEVWLERVCLAHTSPKQEFFGVRHIMSFIAVKW